jgi:DNA modification methylase
MSPEGFLAAMYAVIRECKRVLLPGKNVSIIIEPILPFDDDVLDFPFFLTKKFIEEGFEIVSKVYVPSQVMRNKSLPNIFARARKKRRMVSDCRELLTFNKT